MLAMSNKPTTGVYRPNNKTEVVEKPDLEVGEDCLMVTKDTRQEPDLEKLENKIAVLERKLAAIETKDHDLVNISTSTTRAMTPWSLTDWTTWRR